MSVFLETVTVFNYKLWQTYQGLDNQINKIISKLVFHRYRVLFVNLSAMNFASVN